MSAPLRPVRDKVCTVDGCENKHVAWGMCWSHYQQARKRGRVGPAPTPEGPLCALRGCEQPTSALGMCKEHANPKWDLPRAKSPKPRSRYRRRGERSKEARADRAAYDRRRRRALAANATDALGADGRDELVSRIRSGQGFREACRDMGIAAALVWTRARLLPRWVRELDKALTEFRDPDLSHGSEFTYRRFGCRCPECRKAKARVR